MAHLSPIPARILKQSATLRVCSGVDMWQEPTWTETALGSICIQPSNETRKTKDNTEAVLRSLCRRLPPAGPDGDPFGPGLSDESRRRHVRRPPGIVPHQEAGLRYGRPARCRQRRRPALSGNLQLHPLQCLYAELPSRNPGHEIHLTSDTSSVCSTNSSGSLSSHKIYTLLT